MKNNVGNTDKIVRLVIAIAMLGLYFSGVVTGWMGIAALVVAGIMTLTSVLSFCPLYALFGVKTCGCETTEA